MDWTRHRNDAAMLLALLAATSVVYFATLGGLGLAVDEPPYMHAGDGYARWIAGFARHPVRSASRAGVDAVWSENHEHPPVSKVATGIAGRVFGPVLGGIEAHRSAGLFFLFVTQLSLYFLLAPRYGPEAGLFAGAALVATPHFLGLSQIVALDAPMAALHALTVVAFVKGLESKRWCILTGIIFGLALATKINAFFIPVAMLGWALFFKEKRALRCFGSMLLFAVPTLLLVWPWLWHDTVKRVSQYLFFHARHDFHPTFYFGKVYASPPAPWHYPVVMQAVTTPPVLLALAVGGLIVGLRRFRSDRLSVLLALNAVVPAAVTALAFTPTYDGTRLFLATTVFVSAFAGAGFVALSRYLRLSRPVWVFCLALVLMLPPAYDMIRVYPYVLSYYNTLIGGERGALRAGMESVYWGEACNREVVEWLNDNLPDGATLDTNTETYGTLAEYQRRGLLKPTLSFRKGAAYWVLTSQQGYSSYSDWWLLYEDRHPAYKRIAVWGLPGVPLAWVSKRISNGQPAAAARTLHQGAMRESGAGGR